MSRRVATPNDSVLAQLLFMVMELGSAAEIAQAEVAFLALGIAAYAGILSKRAYDSSSQPVLRVAPVRIGSVRDDLGRRMPATTRPVDSSRLILRNIGRGAAVSIVVMTSPGYCGDSLIAEVDALEPLGETYGPDFKESSRVGRITIINMRSPLLPEGRYRVLYQDIDGRWHETQFAVAEQGFNVRMLGRRSRGDVPDWVVNRSQVVAGDLG